MGREILRCAQDDRAALPAALWPSRAHVRLRLMCIRADLSAMCTINRHLLYGLPTDYVSNPYTYDPPGISECFANSGARYDRYHYHGVARVVGVLSMVVVEAEIEILEVALDFVVAAVVGPNFAVGIAVPILVVAAVVGPNFVVGVVVPILVVTAVVGPNFAVGVGVGVATAWRKLEQMPGLHELYDRCECDAGCRGLSARPVQ